MRWMAGFWRYGDTSEPEVAVTVFAGTSSATRWRSPPHWPCCNI